MDNVQILCVLSDTLTLGLSGVRENAGHDDSLPYQADILVADKAARSGKTDKKTVFRKVGTVCNDGWGGNSEIRADFLHGNGKGNSASIERLRELCRKHKMYFDGKPFAPYTLEGLCDIMAEAYIANEPHFNGKTVLYKLDDDPFVLADSRHRNLFLLKAK